MSSRLERLNAVCAHFGVEHVPDIDDDTRWAAVLGSVTGERAVIVHANLTPLVERAAASVSRHWVPMVIVRLDTGMMYRPVANIVLGGVFQSLDEIAHSRAVS